MSKHPKMEKIVKDNYILKDYVYEQMDKKTCVKFR